MHPILGRATGWRCICAAWLSAVRAGGRRVHALRPRLDRGAGAAGAAVPRLRVRLPVGLVRQPRHAAHARAACSRAGRRRCWRRRSPAGCGSASTQAWIAVLEPDGRVRAGGRRGTRSSCRSCSPSACCCSCSRSRCTTCCSRSRRRGEAERRQLELEILTRDAELRALRAQIDPHFLYNSLNSISALTGSDAPGARRMCLLLGEFLRTTLRRRRAPAHSAGRRARAGRALPEHRAGALRIAPAGRAADRRRRVGVPGAAAAAAAAGRKRRDPRHRAAARRRADSPRRLAARTAGWRS